MSAATVAERCSEVKLISGQIKEGEVCEFDITAQFWGKVQAQILSAFDPQGLPGQVFTMKILSLQTGLEDFIGLKVAVYIPENGNPGLIAPGEKIRLLREQATKLCTRH